MRFRTLAVGLGLIFAATANAADQPVGDFSLTDYRGKPCALADFKDKPLLVLAFVGTECPLAKLYAPRLAELARDYEPKGVGFVAIDPNSQDGVTQIAAYARQHGINFPILKDLNNEVADRLGARRTPEVFVLDARRVVRYRGRIDDQYAIGVQRDKPHDRDLARALDELLAGKAVSTPATEVTGCLIGRAKRPAADSPVTFAKDIAPLFNRRCVECHRPGEIGPFSLTDYAKAAGWAEMIAEVVEDGRMPPWHADPKYGHFANDRRLTDAEKKLISTWVDNGAPAGDVSQLPPTPTFTDGWQLPKPPDAVIAMSDRPRDVPAEGAVRYQYFAAPTHFTEDKWVSAVEVRPGNRAVVHHVLVFARKPGDRGDPDGGGTRGFLASYVPGLRSLPYPAGMAKRVAAGSVLIFQIHYTPNGSPQTDLSRIGFVFADPKTVTHEVRTTSAVTRALAIPPGEADYRVDANSRPAADGSLLLAYMPHMHLRGKAFSYEAVYPDGKRETLLDVPHYDFNWQTAYRLAEPRQLPAGTKVHAVAHFDNSPDNPNNPDPTKRVRWGEQTWDEMMIGYFDVALPKDAAAKAAAAEEKPAVPAGGVPIPERFKALLGRFDTDGDGKLTAAEIEKMPPELRDRVYEYLRQTMP
jgi:peroxiredoxin